MTPGSRSGVAQRESAHGKIWGLSAAALASLLGTGSRQFADSTTTPNSSGFPSLVELDHTSPFQAEQAFSHQLTGVGEG